MGLKVTQDAVFGGVDSRSNPVVMPPARSLRTRNFTFDPAGSLRLRDGYSFVKSIGGSLSSLIGFKLNGTRYANVFSGTTPKLLKIATI